MDLLIAAAMIDVVEKLEKQIKDQRDQLLRALADAENARTIARRDVESARLFSITKFAKSLLEVADTLTLASASIPKEVSSLRVADHASSAPAWCVCLVP